MKAYSLDLRQRIIEAVDNKSGTIAQVAATFRVSPRFVNKLLHQRRARGHIAPLAHGGGKPVALDTQHLAFLQAQVAQQPDATLAELGDALQAHSQVQVSAPTLTRALQKLHLRRKKNTGGQ